MKDVSDDELDEMLARHLAGRLDGQVGRAGRGVEWEVARVRRGMWLRVSCGIAAAAAVVMVIAWPRGAGVKEETRVDNVVEAVAWTGEEQGEIERAVWSEVADEGTVFVEEGRPARKLVRREVERVRWTDPSGKFRIEATVPVEDVMLVDLRKY